MKIVISDCTFQSFEAEQAMASRRGYDLAILQCTSPAELVAKAADADALLVQYLPIDASVFRRLSALKVVVRYGVGVDNVDLEAAARAGVSVCNVPDYGIAEVADHTAAMALAWMRQLPFFDRAIRRGHWPAAPKMPMASCSDLLFGVLGAGRIGRATLRRMAAFGCRLAAYDPFVPADDLMADGIRPMDLETLLTQADALSLHLPLTPTTRHLISVAQLKRMKSTAILINTSRGGLIDTVALASALQDGEIAAAAIDVFESEPLAEDHPLRECGNALLSPHMAYFSEQAIERLQRFAVEEVDRALQGEPLRCPVTV